MGKTVWAVTSGDYSDYRVHGVSSDEDLIDQMVALDRDLRKADLPLLDQIPERSMVLMMNCYITRDGRVDGEFEFEKIQWEWEWGGERPPAVKDHSFDYDGSSPLMYAHVSVSGTDHERVRKVYGEKKAAKQTHAAGIA